MGVTGCVVNLWRHITYVYDVYHPHLVILVVCMLCVCMPAKYTQRYKGFMSSHCVTKVIECFRDTTSTQCCRTVTQGQSIYTISDHHSILVSFQFFIESNWMFYSKKVMYNWCKEVKNMYEGIWIGWSCSIMRYTVHWVSVGHSDTWLVHQ